MESFVRRVNSSIYGVLCAVSFASNRNLGEHARHSRSISLSVSVRRENLGEEEGCFYRVPFSVSIYSYLLVGTPLAATPSNAPFRVTRVYF